MYEAGSRRLERDRKLVSLESKRNYLPFAQEFGEKGRQGEMKAMVDALFDGLSELVYVCDLATHELLYLNKAGRSVYGDRAVEKHEPCYRVLQGREAPCEFCTNQLLNTEEFFEWEATNPVTNRHYVLRDKLIDWDGVLARLEIAFDITERENEKMALALMVDASAMIVDCIRILEADDDLYLAFDEVLRRLGTFFIADRAYVFELEGARVANMREWCNDQAETHKDHFQDIPVSLIENWVETFAVGEAMVIDDIDSLRESGNAEECSMLLQRHVSSLVAVQLVDNGKLIGCIGVENPRLGGRLDVVVTPLLGLAHFVTARMKRDEAQRKVAELIWNDTLTGVRSRAAFHRDYDQGEFGRLGIVLADADGLALVNCEWGRAAGDGILQNIAKTMKSVFDRVYRIGDDEFCAVVEHVDYARFSELATQLTVQFADRDLPASVGTAWQENCHRTVAVLDMAGDRMRRAKRGRHRAVALGVDLASDAAVGSLLCQGGAQRAVEEGKFDIYLMPQSSSRTDRIVGAEALIRYIDEANGTVVLPTSFVLALEDMGEISSVDFFALSRACATLVRWQREGRAVVPISVNFSRLTASDDGFVDRLADTVSGYALDPSLIEVELTESARERSDDLLRQVADGLRSRGFRVAIDDFGVDNANYALFVQLEFDVLKLDKTLVWGLGNDAHSLTVIKGLVGLCADLGIETVAEGIESVQQLDALRSVGCTRAQGFLIGRPMPIAQFEERFL